MPLAIASAISISKQVSRPGGLFTDTPILTWNGDQEDFSPNFNVLWDSLAAAGDSVELLYASDTGFTTDLVTYSHTLTSLEASNGTLSVAITDLDPGVWYAKIRHKLSGSYAWSNYSNVEDITLEVLATTDLLMADGVHKFLVADGSGGHYNLE